MITGQIDPTQEVLESFFPLFSRIVEKDLFLANSREQPSYFNVGSSLTEYKQEPFDIYESDSVVELGDEFIGLLPFKLDHIYLSIERSKYLLELEEDWDDEGGMPISRDTWKKSIAFLINYSVWIFSNYDTIISAPSINPGPDESIDMVWRTERFRLLINIPQDSNRLASFYGDDRNNGRSLKGSIPLNDIQEFFAIWLKNLRV